MVGLEQGDPILFPITLEEVPCLTDKGETTVGAGIARAILAPFLPAQKFMGGYVCSRFYPQGTERQLMSDHTLPPSPLIPSTQGLVSWSLGHCPFPLYTFSHSIWSLPSLNLDGRRRYGGRELPTWGQLKFF